MNVASSALGKLHTVDMTRVLYVGAGHTGMFLSDGQKAMAIHEKTLTP
jgi:hypothetical protein